MPPLRHATGKMVTSRMQDESANFIQVSVSHDLLALFARMRWAQHFEGHQRLAEGNHLFIRPGLTLSPYVGFYQGHDLPQFGPFSYSFSALTPHVSIGAYTSISWNVQVMGVNHPLNLFSTTAAFYEAHPMFEAAYADAQTPAGYRPNPQKPSPTIGNDVWIGQNVLLGRGIVIGDGAVVAAGSVVVKNVPAYAVVGGSPAKVIRYRFTEHERSLLQWSRWWECCMPDLMALPISPVATFVDALADGIDAGQVRRVRQFDTPLIEIIRDGRVTTLLNDGTGLFEAATPLDRTVKPRSISAIELAIPPDPYDWLPTTPPGDTLEENARDTDRSILSRWRKRGKPA